MVTIVPVDFHNIEFQVRPARPIFPWVNTQFGGGDPFPPIDEFMRKEDHTVMRKEDGVPMCTEESTFIVAEDGETFLTSESGDFITTE